MEREAALNDARRHAALEAAEQCVPVPDLVVVLPEVVVRATKITEKLIGKCRRICSALTHHRALDFLPQSQYPKGCLNRKLIIGGVEKKSFRILLVEDQKGRLFLAFHTKTRFWDLELTPQLTRLSGFVRSLCQEAEVVLTGTGMGGHLALYLAMSVVDMENVRCVALGAADLDWSRLSLDRTLFDARFAHLRRPSAEDPYPEALDVYFGLRNSQLVHVRSLGAALKAENHAEVLRLLHMLKPMHEPNAPLTQTQTPHTFAVEQEQKPTQLDARWFIEEPEAATCSTTARGAVLTWERFQNPDSLLDVTFGTDYGNLTAFPILRFPDLSSPMTMGAILHCQGVFNSCQVQLVEEPTRLIEKPERLAGLDPVTLWKRGWRILKCLQRRPRETADLIERLTVLLDEVWVKKSSLDFADVDLFKPVGTSESFDKFARAETTGPLVDFAHKMVALESAGKSPRALVVGGIVGVSLLALLALPLTLPIAILVAPPVGLTVTKSKKAEEKVSKFGRAYLETLVLKFHPSYLACLTAVAKRLNIPPVMSDLTLHYEKMIAMHPLARLRIPVLPPVRELRLFQQALTLIAVGGRKGAGKTTFVREVFNVDITGETADGFTSVTQLYQAGNSILIADMPGSRASTMREVESLTHMLRIQPEAYIYLVDGSVRAGDNADREFLAQYPLYLNVPVLLLFTQVDRGTKQTLDHLHRNPEAHLTRLKSALIGDGPRADDVRRLMQFEDLNSPIKATNSCWLYCSALPDVRFSDTPPAGVAGPEHALRWCCTSNFSGSGPLLLQTLLNPACYVS